MIAVIGNTVQDLRDQIAQLERQIRGSQPEQTQSNAPPPSQMRDKLVELKRRTTRADSSGLCWKLLKAVADRPEPSSKEQLAEDLGLEHADSVRALIAILGKPCSPKHLDITVLQKVPGKPTKYSMSEQIRRIVNELG